MFSSAPLLSKERIVAPPGYNRWLVPPAALAIHLCIGMAYGFSVFWLPLSKAIGISHSVDCGEGVGFYERVVAFFQRAVSTTCDWKVSDLGWMYTLFFVFLGCSAALWGGWLERSGPRKAGVVSACCWCGGLALSALGVYLHQLWMLWLGSGVIGGIGLGLGYISPVSTLIKWFPDKRGMATGMAIMGFGGGAMIGAPLADRLMKFFATPSSVGVWQTFLVLAIVYFVYMMCGAFGYRLPEAGWRPEGMARTKADPAATRYVPLSAAWKTPQFWLVWIVLCMNVTAGIGVIGMASPLLQEVFGGKLIGAEGAGELTAEQLAAIAAIAAGFTGLLSLFNIAGRFFWASLSDHIGRKATYSIFLILGIVLYAAAPWAAESGRLALFVAMFCVILSMYGGGFATVPAYLADLFGTKMVGAIHGRLLTSWSTAGVLGPVLVNYIREYKLRQGMESSDVYSFTMYIYAALLGVGLVCNLLIRPVPESLFIAPDDSLADRKGPSALTTTIEMRAYKRSSNAILALSWLAVLLPLAWGVWVTLEQAAGMFG